MEPANVLFVASSGLTASVGGGWTRMSGEARTATKHGHHLRILCFYPPQHALLRRGLLAAARAALAKEAGSPVHFVPRLPCTRLRWVAWANDLYCASIVLLFCLRYGIRVVQGHGIGPSRLALMARRALRSIRVVADVHGASTEEYLYTRGLTEKDRLVLEMDRRECEVLLHSDWLFFVSRAMLEYYSAKYDSEFPNSCVIPCATESTGDSSPQVREEVRNKYGLQGRLVFCYLGGGDAYQLPGYMCRLFRNIHAVFPESYWLIVSQHRCVFDSMIVSEQVDPSSSSVLSVARDEVARILQAVDIGFLLRDSSVVNRVASPTKFAEYCQAGIPVITTEFIGDFSSAVKDRGLGCVVDLSRLGVDQGLRGFICDVRDNRLEYSRRCQLFAKEQLVWDAYGDVLAGVYSHLASG